MQYHDPPQIDPKLFMVIWAYINMPYANFQAPRATWAGENDKSFKIQKASCISTILKLET